MSEKEYNNIIKILLISSGIIVLAVCLFLYLGDKEMKDYFETSLWFKLALTSLFIPLILILFGICVTIWRNKPSEAFFVSNCKDGYLLVKNSHDKKEASCNLYTDLDTCLKYASDDDLIVIVGKKSKIDSERIILKDMNNNQEKIINLFLEKEMPVFRFEIKTETVKHDSIKEQEDIQQ